MSPRTSVRRAEPMKIWCSSCDGGHARPDGPDPCADCNGQGFFPFVPMAAGAELKLESGARLQVCHFQQNQDYNVIYPAFGQEHPIYNRAGRPYLYLAVMVAGPDTLKVLDELTVRMNDAQAPGQEPTVPIPTLVMP